MRTAEAPPLFILMSHLPPSVRFDLAQKRKGYKSRPSVQETLAKDGRGRWKLIYLRKGLKIGELRIVK
jgi:hypothetical protein